MTNTICIVGDGTFRWGASWCDLHTAMVRLGWTREGSRWTEPPEVRDPEVEQDHYTDLCQTVQPVPGFEPLATFDDRPHASLQWMPDGNYWFFAGAQS